MDGTHIFEVEIVCHAETRPNSFFVRTYNDKIKYDAFHESFQTFYGQRQHDLKFEAPNRLVNGLICVRYEGAFRRAKFLGICKFGKKYICKIYLIDVGRSDTVPLENCFLLPLEFSEKPAFGFRCHLNVVSIEQEWSEEAIKYFQDICREKRMFKSNILFRSTAGYLIKDQGWSAQVDLTWDEIITEGAFGKERQVVCYMSQKLISKGFVKVSCEVIEQDEINQNINDDLESIDLNEPIEKWQTPIIKLAPLDNFVKVRVTHVDEYAQIYYQFSADFAKSRQFRHCFSSFYCRNGSNSDNDKIKESWEPGSACIALWNDNQWYRAKVIEKFDADRYLVFFIDYGNDYAVPLKDMRIPYHFQSTEGLVKRVIIANMVPKYGAQLNQWPKEAIDEIYFYIKDRDVEIKFKEYPVRDMPTKVQLRRKEVLNENEAIWVDARKRMINLGHADNGDFKTKDYKHHYNHVSHTLIGRVEERL